MFFCDESGFNLTPSVPYGWLPIGKQTSIRSSKTKAINLFGLLSRQGKLKVFSTLENINSDYIIDVIDQITESIEKPTVLVLDNAPWHKSMKVFDKMKEWEEKNLYIIFLPTYSPHLNPIETLWRKMKHEWLKADDYLSVKALRESIYNIIKNYDKEFCINFSKNVYL